jgi:hypothetical protein
MRTPHPPDMFKKASPAFLTAAFRVDGWQESYLSAQDMS